MQNRVQVAVVTGAMVGIGVEVRKLEVEQQIQRMTNHLSIGRYQLLLHVRRRQQ